MRLMPPAVALNLPPLLLRLPAAASCSLICSSVSNAPLSPLSAAICRTRLTLRRSSSFQRRPSLRASAASSPWRELKPRRSEIRTMQIKNIKTNPSHNNALIMSSPSFFCLCLNYLLGKKSSWFFLVCFLSKYFLVQKFFNLNNLLGKKSWWFYLFIYFFNLNHYWFVSSFFFLSRG